MLADAPRTLAFREALRRVVKPDDVVIDIGSGSGILAFFAAEAGARKVYAIERGHMADVVAMLARQLGFADRIEVVHDLSTRVELPERGTILVAELLDAFGIEAQVLSLTRDARLRLLRENATYIPSRVVLSIVPVELPDVHARLIRWWEEPRYGFDFSPLAVFASNTVYTADVDARAYLARPVDFLDIDLTTVDDSLVTGTASFGIEREGTMHGFGGWFTATLVEGIALSSVEPHATHWQQAFFPLERPITVTPGTRVELELQSDDGKTWRWRGQVGATAYDQTTALSRPPCLGVRQR